MDFRKLEKIGLVIDAIVLLLIPLLIIMNLEIWWLLSAPYKLTPIEAIAYASPFSLLAIVYFMLITIILHERTGPVIIGHWYTKEFNKEWDKIKNIPISQLQKKILT